VINESLCPRAGRGCLPTRRMLNLAAIGVLGIGGASRPAHPELDVVGAERVEQSSPAAEQDLHEMDLHLVE
jgi:hypothetical protein